MGFSRIESFNGYKIKVDIGEVNKATILLDGGMIFTKTFTNNIYPSFINSDISEVCETQRQLRQHNENIRAEKEFRYVMRELIHQYQANQ